MRCLHCGSSISAFKKLTDTDFCSTEHRDQFHAEQQRLILERLKHSAARFQRYRRSGAVEPPLPVNPAPKPVELQAPAAMAAFLTAEPGVVNCAEFLLSLPPIFSEVSTPFVPPHNTPIPSTTPVPSLIADLPWPRYNHGLRSAVDPTLLVWRSGPVSLSGTRRVYPDVAVCGLPVLDRIYRMRPRAGVPSPNSPDVCPVRLELLTHGIDPVRPVRLQRHARLQPGTRGAFIGLTNCGPVSAARAVPATSAPVTSDNKPSLPTGTWQIIEATPVIFGRTLRLPPGAILDAPRTRFSIAPEPNGFVSQFCTPQSVAPAKLLVLQSDAKMIPAGDQARIGCSGDVPTTESISAEAAPLVSAPAICSLSESVHELNLVRSQRLFRMRPRTGIASLSDFIAVGQEETFLPFPALPSIHATMEVAGDVAPPFVTHMLRLQLRKELDSTSCQKLQFISSLAATFGSAPALIDVAHRPTGNLLPPFVDQLYRGRMRTCGSAELPNCLGAIVALDFEPGKPERGLRSPDGIGGPKPIFMNRMYRMRLKQPAQDLATLSQAIRARHLNVPDPDPVLATMPVMKAAAAPSFLDRLYRMRPKSGKAPAPGATVIACEAMDPRSSANSRSGVLRPELKKLSDGYEQPMSGAIAGVSR